MTNSVTAPKSLRTEVWVFLIAIVVINFIFVSGVGEGIIPEQYYSRGRLVLLGGALVAVALIARGPKAIWELITPLFVWRISPIWFVVAIMWPIVFAILFVLGHAAVTGTPLELFSESGLRLFQREGFLLNIFILALIGEIVWVGYSVKNLSKFYSLQLSAVITGTVWALWWTPMMIYGIGIIPGLSFVGLLMGQIGISFFCAFFYFSTRSGLVILGMQYCFNLSLLAFPVLPNSVGQLGFELYAAIYLVLGFLAVTFLLPWMQKRNAAHLTAAE
jgi:hypothetical protein